MFNFSLLNPDGVIWLLLAGSVASLFINPKYWPYLLAATLLSALWLDRLSISAALVSVTGIGLAALSQKITSKWLVLLHGAILLWVIGLVLHLIPGFHNLLVLDKVMTGPNSIPFTLYLNLDKPMIIFALVALLPGMLGPPGLSAPNNIWPLRQHFLYYRGWLWGLGLSRRNSPFLNGYGYLP